MEMKFKVAVVSDVGLRRKNNEDNFFVPGMSVKPMNNPLFDGYKEFSAERAYMCVCDGMGGHSSGEVASYMAVCETERCYDGIVDNNIKKRSVLNEVINRFIADTNEALYGRTERDRSLMTMGTTMAGLYFMGEKAYFVNVGDSRVYAMKGTKLIQLSIDHADPNCKNAITRYLGMSSEYGQLDADVAIKPAAVGAGRRYLICSDGLTDMVDDETISSILIRNKNPKSAAHELVETAKKNGGRDNITVIVIDAEPKSTIGKIVSNKAVIVCIAAALLAGAAAGSAYVMKPDVRVTTSVEDLAKAVKDSDNYKEAYGAAMKLISDSEKNIKGFSDYAKQVEKSDDNISNKLQELKEAIDTYKEKYSAFKDRIEEIDNSGKSDEEKFEAIKAESSEDLEKAVHDCEDKTEAVRTAISDYKEAQKKKEEEEKKQQQAVKTDSGKGHEETTGERVYEEKDDSGYENSYDTETGSGYSGGSRYSGGGNRSYSGGGSNPVGGGGGTSGGGTGDTTGGSGKEDSAPIGESESGGGEYVRPTPESR